MDSPVQSQKPEAVGTGEEIPSGVVDNLVLPHLVRLIIRDPIKLDGNLLQKIVRARTKRNRKFQLKFRSGTASEVVVIDDWEARGWMN